ncbi:hypothetical protein LIA77_06275 [Sarocladium implicatum]|nr:hypothetical protein LIA77_06275 [Sarocladium implicatum]
MKEAESGLARNLSTGIGNLSWRANHKPAMGQECDMDLNNMAGTASLSRYEQLHTAIQSRDTKISASIMDQVCVLPIDRRPGRGGHCWQGRIGVAQLSAWPPTLPN